MSAGDVPSVSIITVVRNGATTIARALDSVRSQRNVHVEHIVIDGASTDGTVDIIRKYASSRLHWVSEPDSGIYHAMNKGLALARGEWVYFLGSDDAIADPSVLADILSVRSLGSVDLVCGYSRSDAGQQYTPQFSWRTYLFNTIHHQAAFYRRHLFDNYCYRTDIPVVADYEMNLLIHLERRPSLFLDRCISICGSTGVSRSCSQLSTQLDYFKIRARHINQLFNSAIFAAGLANVTLVRLLHTR